MEVDEQARAARWIQGHSLHTFAFENVVRLLHLGGTSLLNQPRTESWTVLKTLRLKCNQQDSHSHLLRKHLQDSGWSQRSMSSLHYHGGF